MGLRIIDRVKGGGASGLSHEITDAERLAGLAAEAKHWADLRGQRQQLDIQRDFIDNFRRVKARMDSPAQVVELASRVRDNIMGMHGDGASAHSKVDIATLLELL